MSNFDVQPKAEVRALDAVKDYIAGLERQIVLLESLRDNLALIALNLIDMLRIHPLNAETAARLVDFEKRLREL